MSHRPRRVSPLTPMGHRVLRVLLFWGLLCTIPQATTAAGEETPILRIETGMHMGTVTSVAVDRAGRYAVTGSLDQTVRLFDLRTGALLSTLRPPTDGGLYEGLIRAVALSPDGQTIAAGGFAQRGRISGGEGCPIFLFDRRSGRLLRRIPGPGSSNPDAEEIVRLAFSPDGKFLVTARGEGGVYVLRLGTGAPVSGEVPVGQGVYGADFDGKGRLVIAYHDGTIQLFDPTWHEIYHTSVATDPPPFRVRFSPDGKRIAVGHAGRPLLDVLSGEDLHPLYQPDVSGAGPGDLRNVAWSTDGQVLFAAGEAKTAAGHIVRLWAQAGKGRFRDVPVAREGIVELAPAPQGAAFAAEDPAWGIVGKDGKRHLFLPPPLLPFTGHPEALLLDRTGDRVRFPYKAKGGSTVRAASFSIGERRLVLDPPPDDRLAPPRTTGLLLPEWLERDNLKLAGKDLLFAEIAHALAVAPDGESLALGTSKAVRVVGKNGVDRWRMDVLGQAWAVNFSGDGLVVVAALGDGTVRYYRAADGKELLALYVHPDGVRYVLLTPAGDYDASPTGESLLGWHKNGDAGPSFSPVSAYPGHRQPQRVTDSFVKDRQPPAPREEPPPPPPSVTLRQPGTQRRPPPPPSTGFAIQPKLYVLAVGVSKYQRKDLRLDYAAKDARDLSEAWKVQSGKLYRGVEVRLITDGEATRDHILDGLEWLQRQTTSKDVAVLFLAGHGINDPSTGKYYFVPYDGDTSRVLRTLLAGTVLQNAISGVAGKVLVFLDTCHAGNVLGDRVLRGERDISHFVRELTSAEQGVVVFTAATGEQASQEAGKWHNGAFTRAIVEALSGKADYGRSGRITLNMLDLYLSERVKALTNGTQTPTTAKPQTLQDFPIAISP